MSSDRSQPLSEAAKVAALEILALVQRAGDDDDMATQIATKVQDAIDSASDAHLGLLRHVARILTPAAMNAEGSGAAIVRAVAALRDAGISYEPWLDRAPGSLRSRRAATAAAAAMSPLDTPSLRPAREE